MRCKVCQTYLHKQVVCAECFSSQAVTPFIAYKREKALAAQTHLQAARAKVESVTEQQKDNKLLKTGRWESDQQCMRILIKKRIQSWKQQISALKNKIKWQMEEQSRLEGGLTMCQQRVELAQALVKVSTAKQAAFSQEVSNLELCSSTLIAKCRTRKISVAGDILTLTSVSQSEVSRRVRINRQQIPVLEEDHEGSVFVQSLILVSIPSRCQFQELKQYIWGVFVRLYLLQKLMSLNLPYPLRVSLQTNTFYVGSRKLFTSPNTLGEILRSIISFDKLKATINVEALGLLQVSIETLATKLGHNFSLDADRALQMGEDLVLKSVQNKWRGFADTQRSWQSWLQGLHSSSVLREKEEIKKEKAERQILVYVDEDSDVMSVNSSSSDDSTVQVQNKRKLSQNPNL